jgi:hypothetical protein
LHSVWESGPVTAVASFAGGRGSSGKATLIRGRRPGSAGAHFWQLRATKRCRCGVTRRGVWTRRLGGGDGSSRRALSARSRPAMRPWAEADHGTWHVPDVADVPPRRCRLFGSQVGVCAPSRLRLAFRDLTDDARGVGRCRMWVEPSSVALMRLEVDRCTSSGGPVVVPAADADGLQIQARRATLRCGRRSAGAAPDQRGCATCTAALLSTSAAAAAASRSDAAR